VVALSRISMRLAGARHSLISRTVSLFARSSRVLALGLILIPCMLAAQEESGEPATKDRYRVELLFFTPRSAPDREYLDNTYAPATFIGAEMLHGEKPLPRQEGPAVAVPAQGDMPDDGTQPVAQSPVSDFSRTLLPQSELHLAQARNRLRNSGRYDVKFLVGWEEAFPPGHQTPPLLVRVGETKNGYADIEGTIQIERQRYLHVNAQLYDLDLAAMQTEQSPQADSAQAKANQLLLEISENEALDLLLLDAQTAPDENAEPSAPPVVSVMRETRRMRSEKLHFLDAPTMGLLVYFHPLD